MKRTRSVIESDLAAAKRRRSEAEEDTARLEQELGEDEGAVAERLGSF